MTQTQDIHWVGWASQPDLQIWCDGSFTTPSYREAHTDTPDVYRTADGRLYTFDCVLATCEACRRKGSDE